MTTAQRLIKPIDRKKFYASVRNSLFAGKLSSKQVEGMEATFDEWDKWMQHPEWGCDNDIRKLAYIFATDYHEGGRTMQPVKEIGGNAYYVRKYWTNKVKAKELGNKNSQDAIDFCGKGKPQTTGRGNYIKMGKILGYDLVNNPDMVMDLKISTEIMFEGMLTGRSFRGDFTGKSLNNYFNKTKDDPIGARYVVNGVDDNNLIAQIYYKFLEALK